MTAEEYVVKKLEDTEKENVRLKEERARILGIVNVLFEGAEVKYLDNDDGIYIAPRVFWKSQGVAFRGIEEFLKSKGFLKEE